MKKILSFITEYFVLHCTKDEVWVAGHDASGQAIYSQLLALLRRGARG